MEALDIEGKQVMIGQRVIFTHEKNSGVRLGVVIDMKKDLLTIEYTWPGGLKVSYRKYAYNVYAC